MLVNRRAGSQSVTLQFNNVSVYGNRFDAWRTSSTQGFSAISQVNLSSNRVTLSIPAKSITTLRATTL